MVNDFLEIHKGWLRESNLIEDVDDPNADEEAWNAFRRFSEGSITRETILRLHWDIMFRLNRRIAGEFRKCNVFVGGRRCPPWKLVPSLMNGWLDRSSTANSRGPIRQAHIEFERIHPFEDGNGRVGRIIMNHQRMIAGLDVLVIYAKDRLKYYKWFALESRKQMGIRT